MLTRKTELPTPALAVDLDLLEANITRMQQAVSASGRVLRPHAKAHKRVEIAQRQIDEGAVGVCAATISEMTTMVDMGFSVLLTTPVATRVKTDRIAELASMGDVAAVVDHPEQVALYADSADRMGIQLCLLVDLDVGDHRTGIPCDQRAIDLALAIQNSPHLRFGGLQAYSVSGSHTQGWEERRAHSAAALAPALALRAELFSRGLDASRFTGGSTGTFDIDLAIDGFTELQAGSYPLMDVAYGRIGGVPFSNALHVLSTVISASHSDRVTLDAGFKALSTDRPFGPMAEGYAEAQWHWAGDEHGILTGSSLPALGEQVALVPPHVDPTVNLHEAMYACRGKFVAEVWRR